MEKCLILQLSQEIHKMSLEHLVLRESKNFILLINTQWQEYVKRTQQPTEELSITKLELFSNNKKIKQ